MKYIVSMALYSDDIMIFTMDLGEFETCDEAKAVIEKHKKTIDILDYHMEAEYTVFKLKDLVGVFLNLVPGRGGQAYQRCVKVVEDIFVPMMNGITKASEFSKEFCIHSIFARPCFDLFRAFSRN